MIKETMIYIKEKQLGEATGHDWWHSKRVYDNAMKICKEEEADVQVVALAALLHDIDDWKLNGGDEEAGPKAAKAWLKSLGAEKDLYDHVAEIIHDLSYKGTEKQSKMRTLEGKIVQDADRLDAIGAVGIARTFAFGGYFKNEVFNPDIEPRLTIDAKAYQDHEVKSSTINHFYEKLFHVKDLMNTKLGKTLAKSRHDYLVNYVRLFLEEGYYETSVHYKYLKDFIDDTV